MLQRLLEVSGRRGQRPQVFCNSVYAALSGLVQELFVIGNPVVDLVSTDSVSQNQQVVFDQVQHILIQSRLSDFGAPISETKAGLRRLRVANPYYTSLYVPPRIRLDGSLEPAAALLQAFLILRVRYQVVGSDRPLARLEALADDDPAIDTLYLVGDAFTERYPVHAELIGSDAKIILTLTGDSPAVTGGLTWARGDYIRSRDASLLLHPLKEALDSPARPLVVPRELVGTLGPVRARLPSSARSRIAEIHWVTSLHALADGLPPHSLAAPDLSGAHKTWEPSRAGYVVATSSAGTESILPVRALERPSPQKPIPPETSDGRLAITFEALGGAREIAANSYYYGFGHRGLLVDVGYDATRDGWLGVPALERIRRLDAIVLTHAHLDHVGALPLLLAVFPRVPVYCTMPTFAVLGPTLRDSARVAAIRLSETGEAPSMSRGLANLVTQDRFRILPYDVATSIPEIPGLTIILRDAGHVIGSAAAELCFGGVGIIHTGDISVENQHLLRGMRINELSADHVVMEGTYSGEPEFGRADRRAAVEQFFDALRERLADGGSVLIPAFSLGRAQELVAMIADWSERAGIQVPIRTVGLVNVLNEISATHLEFLPGAQGNPFQKCRPLDIRPVPGETDKERAARYAGAFLVAASEAPSVIVASHGMMVENTGSYLIGRAILEGTDPRHAVFLCGYMDPRTPGFRLRNQKHRAVIDYGAGDPVRRNIPSERIHFYRLTAHASYEELADTALSLPSKSLTLIHGESASLMSFKADLERRFASANRPVEVRVPAIGERLLIDHAMAPADWELDDSEQPITEVLTTDRRFLGRGFSVRGQNVDDRDWVLIPVGRTSITLALEHERLAPERIDRVTIAGRHGARTVVYDRSTGQGRLTNIDSTQPDDFFWYVDAREPDGQLARSRLSIRCGAELRPTRKAISAAAPVLELHVGGAEAPEFIGARIGLKGKTLPVAGVQWLSDSRVLRVRLEGHQELGLLSDVHVALRWPNGFVQEGPSLGTFSLEPDIEFAPAAAVVGRPVTLSVVSTPQASAARFDGVPVAFDPNGFAVVPRRPGISLVELGYRTSDGEVDWREAGAVHVAPAARLEIVGATVVDQDIQFRVTDIAPHLRGKEVALRLGDEIPTRWSASDSPYMWKGTVDEAGIIEVAVIARADELVLCTRNLEVHSGLALDAAHTFPITSADGILHAELTWRGPEGYDRAAVERAARDGGFAVIKWIGDTIHVRGESETLGWKEIHVSDGQRLVNVRVLTIRSLKLSLTPPGLLHLGQAVSLELAGDELGEGLNSLDGGPLTIYADRIEPFFDDLSVRVEGNRIHFINPGKYSIALTAYGRRLAEVEAAVRPPAALPRPTPGSLRATETSAYAAATRISELSASIVSVLSAPDGSFEILQDEPNALVDATRQFLEGQLRERAKLVITWPGLSLPNLGGDLLRELRSRNGGVLAAHLSYPAPRGEIVSGAENARRVRAYGVLCCALAHATIDRWDAYACPRCRGRLLLQTNSQSIWLTCPACAYEDRDIILTLARLRTSDVQVLFADYRMARYLRQGTGSRYGGSFSRSVRCTRCHAIQPAYSRPVPWDKTELDRLVTATLDAWSVAAELEIERRAARVAARRTSGSTLADSRRLEDSIHRLIVAGVFNDGRVVVPLDRLEAGLSLCCGARLMWSRVAVAHIFIGLEELTADSLARHPGLASGELGVRQLLALAAVG